MDYQTSKKAGYFTLLFVIGFAILSIFSLVTAISSMDWEPTPGVVIERSIITKPANDNGTSYSVEILYTYTVSGKSYNSTNLDPSGVTSWHETEEEARSSDIYQNYPPGREVTVFYDPNDPQKSALTHGVTFKGIVIPIATFFLFLFSLSLLNEKLYNKIWKPIFG